MVVSSVIMTPTLSPCCCEIDVPSSSAVCRKISNAATSPKPSLQTSGSESSTTCTDSGPSALHISANALATGSESPGAITTRRRVAQSNKRHQLCIR